MPDTNEPLRVGLVHYEPEVFACALYSKTLAPTPNCSRPGWQVELFGETLQLANISYKVVPVLEPVIDWGVFIPDQPTAATSWTGLLGQLSNRTFDVVVNELSITSQISVDFKLASPAGVNDLVYVLLRQPSTNVWRSSTTMFRVFDAEVMICFLSIVVALLVSILISDRVHQRRNFGNNHRLASALLMSYFLLFSGGLYQLCLSVNRLYPEHDKPIKNWKDLVDKIKSKEYTFITETLSYTWYQLFEKSNLSTYGQMKDALRVNPVFVVNDTDLLLGNLTTERYIYAARRSRAQRMVRDHCNLTIADFHQTVTMLETYTFNREAPIDMDAFNHAAMTLLKVGTRIQDRYMLHYLSRYCTEDGDRRFNFSWRPLTLVTVMGLLVLLAAGAVAGMIAYVVEQLIANGENKVIVYRF